MYVLGIDAGGTKTHCVIADENENILAESFAGASQHFRISPTLCLVCQVLTVKMILPC